MAISPERIKAAPLPFPEAVAFWEDKVPLSEEAFFNLSEEARRRAFTVTNVTKMEIITDVFDAVGRAIGEGQSLGQFKSSYKEMMTRRGWEGGSAWHAETIYRTNIQTGYAVGRHDQMRASTREYWRYGAIVDAASRDEHSANHNRVYHRDHPFWQTWYPLNGFN